MGGGGGGGGGVGTTEDSLSASGHTSLADIRLYVRKSILGAMESNNVHNRKLRKFIGDLVDSSNPQEMVHNNLRPRHGTILGTGFSFCQEIVTKRTYRYAKHALASNCIWIL